MEGFKKFLRWLAVLPGAIVALILSYAIIKLFMMLSNWFVGISSDSPYMKLAEIFVSGLSGYYFVYIGSKIAPSSRKEVAYALTGIIFLVGGAIVFNDILRAEYYNAVASAATAIGGMVFLYMVNSGEVSFENPILK